MPNDNTLGGLLVGAYVAVSLYGLTSHQMYRYFRMYPADQDLLKIMVAVMWILDTLHTILIVHACYYYLVTDYFSMTGVTKSVWSLRISISLTGIITTIAHSFFSRRIYIFSRNTLTTSIIMIFSFLRLCCTIATTVVSFTFASFSRFENQVWLVCLSLGLSIISDLIITGSLCWFLQKSKTGFEKTDGIIDSLLLYAINTGLLCIIFDLVVLICAGAMKRNLIYIGLYFVISKLYSNSLLAVLNSRSGLVRDSNQHGSFELNEVPLDSPRAPAVRDPLVLNLRRRKQPQLTNLGIYLEQGESISIGQALGELKTRADDDSDMGAQHSDKGVDLAHELTKEDSKISS